MKDRIIFRACGSCQELTGLLKLRYDIFHTSKLAAYIIENSLEMDIDRYDLHSRHFGLFLNDQLPIGYLRMVENGDGTHNDDFCSCLQALLAKNIEAHSKNSRLFPCLEYLPEAEKVGNFCLEKVNSGEPIVEISRLCIDPRYRSLALVRHFCLCIMAFGYFCHDVKHVLITCSPLHKPFYAKLGITPMEGTKDHVIHGSKRSCLYGSKDTVPANLHGILEKMKSHYTSEKTIAISPP